MGVSGAVGVGLGLGSGLFMSLEHWLLLFGVEAGGVCVCVGGRRGLGLGLKGRGVMAATHGSEKHQAQVVC